VARDPALQRERDLLSIDSPVAIGPCANPPGRGGRITMAVHELCSAVRRPHGTPCSANDGQLQRWDEWGQRAHRWLWGTTAKAACGGTVTGGGGGSSTMLYPIEADDLRRSVHRASARLPADEVEGGEMGQCLTRKMGVAVLLTDKEGRKAAQ
jgi:hypothetical protein